ncbi:hypothetical protein [Stenotrophomonas geniculata]|uniref:hypothetical protein n=1 Tax=Stenotrophomonas geniculata TaxID=86188 RepID=UPI002E7664FB|nr:hypothetical protein [Stenotrophomonas geniculata]
MKKSLRAAIMLHPPVPAGVNMPLGLACIALLAAALPSRAAFAANSTSFRVGIRILQSPQEVRAVHREQSLPIQKVADSCHHRPITLTRNNWAIDNTLEHRAPVSITCSAARGGTVSLVVVTF